MSEYKGLNRLLHFVRGAQNYAAVVAEGLILLAFAGSSLDVSIGGKLAGIGWLAVGWGIVFALGIDTSFILSWVRVRQIAMGTGKKRHLWWAIPLAVGMSFIVFQPVAIQQLQQSMGLSFNQALTNLGIDLNLLVYARSGVAVLLGAVLAMTNVETPKVQKAEPIFEAISVTPVDASLQIAEAPRFSSIYKLVDPRSETPFYVGQTSRNIEERLTEHITHPTSRQMRNFMDDLEALELRPYVELLERVPRIDGDQREQYWINTLRDEGHQLLNAANPSFSLSRPLPSPETRVRNALVTCRDRLMEDRDCTTTEIARLAGVPRSTADGILKRIKQVTEITEVQEAASEKEIP